MGKSINATNYFVASAGEFRKLPSRATRMFLASVGDDVKWAGETWKFNFRSVSSFYWTNGTHLIRVSDHWSRGCVRCECGNVARCWWMLADRSRSLKKGCVGGFYAGLVPFAGLSWRR